MDATIGKEVRGLEQHQPDLMTTSELAELLRAPEPTVRFWRHQGTGPRGFRVGRRVLYPRAEVERWLAERAAAEPAGHQARD